MELTYDFPRAIDNTMRVAFDACQRKFLLAHIYNLRKSDPSMHLVFGGAFAAGLETARLEYYAHGNRDKADYLGKACIAAIKEWYSELDDPLDSEAKSLNNCLGAILYYFQTYPMESDWCEPLTYGDGKASVEFTFAIPLPQFHPATKDPMLYTGRFDLLARFQGMPAIEDDKTATQLGKSWVEGWDLDSQVTGYIWAARQSGIETTTALIRGTSILKYDFGHAQAIQYRTEWHIENWYNVLNHNLDGMISCYEEGPESFLPSYGQACKAYGGCPYRDLCDKHNWDEWIEPDFHHYVWDPLAIAGVESSD